MCHVEHFKLSGWVLIQNIQHDNCHVVNFSFNPPSKITIYNITYSINVPYRYVCTSLRTYFSIANKLQKYPRSKINIKVWFLYFFFKYFNSIAYKCVLENCVPIMYDIAMTGQELHPRIRFLTFKCIRRTCNIKREFHYLSPFIHVHQTRVRDHETSSLLRLS